MQTIFCRHNHLSSQRSDSFLKHKVEIWSEETSPYGGVGTALDEIIFGLSHCNYEIRLVTNLKKETRLPDISGYSTKNVNGKMGPFAFVWYGILNKSKTVLILNDVRSIYSYGVLSFLRLAAKKQLVVVNIHGSEIDRFLKNVNFKRRVLLYPFFMKVALTRSHRINCVSKFLKNKFLSEMKNLKIKIDENKCKTFYIGAEYFSKTSEEIRPDIQDVIQSARSRNMTIIVSAGRMDNKKGYPSMIEIFRHLPSNKFLWIVCGGVGKDSEIIKRKLEKTGCHYYLTGNISRGMLSNIYRKSDLFWLLSDYDEGFGLSWYEALLCGLKVIGRPRGALPEFIGSETGFLSENNDEISSFLCNYDSSLTTSTTRLENEIQSNYQSFLPLGVDGMCDLSRKA